MFAGEMLYHLSYTSTAIISLIGTLVTIWFMSQGRQIVFVLVREPGMVVHLHSCSTEEAQARGSLELRSSK
jgi:hypothetical protein